MGNTNNDKQNAELSYIYDTSGTIDPTLVPIEAAFGTTYKLLTSPPKFFQKQDNGTTTNWKELSLDYNFSQVGTGFQVIKSVNQNTRTVEFRTFKSTTGLVITQNTNDLTFTLTGVSYNLDGGQADSIYGGIPVVDGGNA